MAQMSSVPTVEPWSALLEAGRADERLVREAFEGARAAEDVIDGGQALRKLDVVAAFAASRKAVVA